MYGGTRPAGRLMARERVYVCKTDIGKRLSRRECAVECKQSAAGFSFELVDRCGVSDAARVFIVLAE